MASQAQLNPVAVKAANERLWAAHPELNRRTLTSSAADVALGLEWSRYYKEEVEKIIKSNINHEKKSIPEPSTTQKCTDHSCCGQKSTTCQDALNGKKPDGTDVPEEDLKKIKDTLSSIRSLRKKAKALGYDRAVEALDHWLDKCGDFKEIDATKTQEVRNDIGKRHNSMFIEKIKQGIKSALAYELVNADNIEPEVDLNMTWKGGGSTSIIGLFTDDGLAYFGESIHSSIDFKCVKASTKDGISYICKPINWKSWVEDNYDFEGNKTTHMLPTDAEMLLLQKYGCGKNYRRSSKSWDNDTSNMWVYPTYSSVNEIKLLKAKRTEKLKQDSLTTQAEIDRGALPASGPAENYIVSPTPSK